MPQQHQLQQLQKQQQKLQQTSKRYLVVIAVVGVIGVAILLSAFLDKIVLGKCQSLLYIIAFITLAAGQT